MNACTLTVGTVAFFVLSDNEADHGGDREGQKHQSVLRADGTKVFLAITSVLENQLRLADQLERLAGQAGIPIDG